MANERVRPPVAPVQRVTDFMAGSAGQDADLPSSSYRLGVRAGPLHEVLSPLLDTQGSMYCFFAGALSSDYFAPACLATRHDTLPSLFFVFFRQQSIPKGKNSFGTCLCSNQPLRGFPTENDDLSLSE